MRGGFLVSLRLCLIILSLMRHNDFQLGRIPGETMTATSARMAGFGVPKTEVLAEGNKERRGGSTGRSGGWTAEEMRHLMRLVSEGKSNQEIAELLGRTATAVSVKASRFGLKRPQSKDLGPGYTMRFCMGCRSEFPSSGPGNRFCEICKSSDLWSSGSTFTLR